MKKTFPHKAHLSSTPTSYNSQSSLANTLKAIVSSQLKLDKKSTDDQGRTTDRTGSTRKPSIAARVPKAANQSSNSLLPGDESIRPIRNHTNEDVTRQLRLTSRQRAPLRETSKELASDPLSELRKEVALLREEMNRKWATDNRLNLSQEKQTNFNHCLNDTWTQKCLTHTSSSIVSASEFQFRPDTKDRNQEDCRLDALEKSLGEERNELNQKFSLFEKDIYRRNSELAERMAANEAQQYQLRCEVLGLRGCVGGADKQQRLDRLQANLLGVMGRLDTVEHSKRDTLSSNIIQIRSFSSNGGAIETNCCKKETTELKKELTDLKTQVRSLNSLLITVGEQTDRYSNIEAEIKEQLRRVEARTDTKSLSQKIGEFEQILAQHDEYVQTVECKIAKNFRQCEQAVNKFIIVEGKLEQFTRRPELELLTAEVKDAVEGLQTEINSKLMTIITEYNENFLSIENSVCDMRDIFFENLEINKNLIQKMQTVCRYQANESHQLQELYKTSDDVYTLLENNVQRICELSKKEMCFEHEFKELREKVEGVDALHHQTVNPKRRMTSSFSSSFSEMKSKIMGELKGEGHSRDSFKRFNLTSGRNMTTLMDESIQDQSGEFDRD